ncbi:hypothetical protein [Streptomyces sp. DSM 40907]|uniref:hypothetical protein n=1 Tax=Streptomyces kutzneri TaxID=3051179 RepID=UPI0028D520D3|nr:hypothetical protein [Streptomyces sp. DSM 40907]
MTPSPVPGGPLDSRLSAELRLLWAEYKRVTGSAVQARIAQATGTRRSTLNDWFTGASTPTDFDALWPVLEHLLTAVHQRRPLPPLGRPLAGNDRARAAVDRPWWAEQRSRWEALHREALLGRSVPDHLVVDGQRYVVEPFPDAAGSQEWGTPPAPSRLLGARHHVIDFVGRHEELESLAQWRDDPSVAWAVQVCCGPGGQGKTRLAQHFAAQSQAQGWQTVTIRPQRPLSALRRPRTEPAAQNATGGAELQPGRAAESSATGRRTAPRRPDRRLVVIDYADRWPVGHLLAALAAIFVSSRVRVLLLARAADSWWSRVRAELEGAEIAHDAVPLAAIAPGETERADLFDRAVRQFAEVLQLPGIATARKPAGLADDRYGQVLAIHMAALSAVLASTEASHTDGSSGPPSPGPEIPGSLSAPLLRREQAYWRSLAAVDPGAVRTADLERTVFIATLTRSTPYDEAVDTVARALEVTRAEARVAVEAHSACYPSSASVLEPLLPDRLGEDFLALVLPGGTSGDYTPERLTPQWSQDALPHILHVPATPQAVRGLPGELFGRPAAEPATGGPSPARHRAARTRAQEALGMLVEAAVRWPHVAERHLNTLFGTWPGLALAAGGPVVARFAALAEASPEVLGRIYLLLPWGNAEFAEAAASALERCLPDLLALGPVPEQHVFLLLEFSHRLGFAGRLHEAADAAVEAVAILEREAVTAPSHRPGLADALGQLAQIRAASQELEQAIEAGERALEVHEALAADEPAADVLAHSAALVLLATLLVQVDRHADGLPRAEKAVRLLEPAAGEGPRLPEPEHQARLAEALTMLGAIQADLGAASEAALSNSAATDLYRSLPAQVLVPRQGHALANLNNRAVLLSRAGRVSEAVEAADVAIALAERMYGERPDLHEADLARLLTLRSGLRWQEAPAEAEKDAGRAAELLAARIESPWRSRERTTYMWALINQSLALSELGRHEDALRLTESARSAVVRLHPVRSPALPSTTTTVAHVLATFAGIRLEAGRELDRAREAAETACSLYALLPPESAARISAEIADCTVTRDRLRASAEAAGEGPGPM